MSYLSGDDAILGAVRGTVLAHPLATYTSITVTLCDEASGEERIVTPGSAA